MLSPKGKVCSSQAMTYFQASPLGTSH